MANLPTREAPIFTAGLLPASEPWLRAFIQGVEPAFVKVRLTATQVVAQAVTALLEVLDERKLTKQQLGVELSNRVSQHLAAPQLDAWRSPSWYALNQSLGEAIARFALPVLALHGLVCLGERQGDQAYLVRTDQWLGALLPEANREQAFAELARRYLHCYGPSRPEDFAGWAGISPEQAAHAWKSIQPELVELNFEGKPSWLNQQDLAHFWSPQQAVGACFLPPHEPYLQMRDQPSLVSEKDIQRQVWRFVGNPGVVLSVGRFVGTWRPRKTGALLKLAIRLLKPVSHSVRAEIEAEAETLAPFKGSSAVEVEFSP